MSPTLFKYIFKDLFRIFMLTSGALTGIMSFGGMLKPLYEVGLDVSQVGQILTFSGPAMMAYSLPIAALFATTIVYGRLGADNEITACRAAGISFMWMTLPAFVLGITTAFIAVVMLCYAVPASMLKVERIVYSNLAQFVAGQIERKHQIRLEQGNKQVNVFASSAHVHPFDPSRPNEQAVTLVGPVIAIYVPFEKSKILTPEEFYMASEATAYITQTSTDEVMLTANLVGGTKFPRVYGSTPRDSAQLSIGMQRFNSAKLASPVRENTKFMNITRLNDLLHHPEQSKVIASRLNDFIQQDQEREFLEQLGKSLNEGSHTVSIDASDGTFTLIRGAAPAEMRDGKLFIAGTPDQPARLIKSRSGQTIMTVEAADIRVKAFAYTDQKLIDTDVEMYNCTVDTAGIRAPRGSLLQQFTVTMPPSIVAVTTRPVGTYVQGRISSFNQEDLNRNFIKLVNSITSEIHARLSFAVSCLVLVMVGCALGMMFRSGNFLSAFAVSIVPALTSIALIVTGQHTSENVPAMIPAVWANPLGVGIIVIWSGNAVVAVICIALLSRLQRQ